VYHPVRPKWFLRHWYVWRKPCTNLALKLTLSPKGSKRDSRPTSPRSSIRCVQIGFWGYGTFGVNCGSIMHLILTLSPNGLKLDSTWPKSPRSFIGCVRNDFWAYGTFGANRAPILNQDYHCIQTDRNDLPFEPRHLGVPSGASKTISKAMVHLLQTVYLSCTETNTVSKRTETSFHLSLVTQEYHPVQPKQFLSLWYVWHKPCTYHAPKLTLSPKGLKRDFTWPTSPRSSIGCVQIGFWGYGTFGANWGSILHRY
jgi:hypothetical protein